MKHLTLVLLTTLLAVSSPHADEGLRVRYLDPSGPMSLTVSHDIEIQVADPVKFSRDFSFDLTLAVDRAAEAVTVTIDQARATYVAHEMKERLGTRHLTGQTFPLSIGDDGRQLAVPESAEMPTIDLGPYISPGFSIADVLAGSMPLLPQEDVAVGASWTTERPLRSLSGWNWTAGNLTSRHRVSAVDRKGGHIVITVATEAEASLGPVEEGQASFCDLTRTLRWSFDITDGRLLSMSMEQDAQGITVVPQGELPIHQVTRVELTPR